MIYGVKNGGDRKSKDALRPVKTQKDISNQLGTRKIMWCNTWGSKRTKCPLENTRRYCKRT